MTYEVNGRTLETTESGFLVNQDDWDKDVAQAIASAEGLTLTQDHWDVIDYLREAYLETMRNHNTALNKAAIGFGFDYIRMDTHESVGPALSYLLARRNAQIKRSKSG